MAYTHHSLDLNLLQSPLKPCMPEGRKALPALTYGSAAIASSTSCFVPEKTIMLPTIDPALPALGAAPGLTKQDLGFRACLLFWLSRNTLSSAKRALRIQPLVGLQAKLLERHPPCTRENTRHLGEGCAEEETSHSQNQLKKSLVCLTFGEGVRRGGRVLPAVP
jgi:hypothetical protein